MKSELGYTNDIYYNDIGTRESIDLAYALHKLDISTTALESRIMLWCLIFYPQTINDSLMNVGQCFPSKTLFHELMLGI